MSTYYANSRMVPCRTSVLLLWLFLYSFFNAFVCEGLQNNEFWYPTLSNTGEKDLEKVLFRQVSGLFFKELTHKLNGLISASKINVSNFIWIKSTTSRECTDEGQIGWLIFSGWERQSDHLDAFTSLGTGVIACMILPDESQSFGFRLDDCHSIEMTSRETTPKDPRGFDQARTFPIMELVSLEMEPRSNGGLLVYCDHLWQADGVHPGGRCRLHLLKNGRWTKLDNIFPGSRNDIQFCSSVNHSVPCLGGVSVAIRQVFSGEPSTLPNIELIAGLPYSKELGEVQLFTDILKPFGTSDTFKGSNTDRNFGNRVMWLPSSGMIQGSTVSSIKSSSPWLQDNLFLVSSTDFMRPGLAAIKQTGGHLTLQGLITPPTKNESSTKGPSVYGFGFALETINVPAPKGGNLTDYGILIGSPFETDRTTGVNVGRVYVLCPSIFDQSEGAEHHFSVLQGRRENEFFGYSIASVGDIDGDGIDEVAIGAPALKDGQTSTFASPIHGRVYIHKVTRDCQFDQVPLQVLQAHNSQVGDGFGFSVTRGIDLDGDKSPELIITSLQPGVSPYLFTMPRRLRAVCKIDLENSFNMLPFQAGTKIPLTVTVRLLDPQTNKIVDIPMGLLSTQLRTHQINPDVLFRDVPTEAITGLPNFNNFKASRSGIHPDFYSARRPRFLVKRDVPISIRKGNAASLMEVGFSLQPQLGMRMVNFEGIPLVVAYRSLMNVEACDKDPDQVGCMKHQQPVVDWSACQSKVELVTYICVPRPNCSADLSLMELTRQQSNEVINKSEHETKGSSKIPAEPVYGSSASRHVYMRVRLMNRGPTKATEVQVYLQVLGREFDVNQSAGFRLHIDRVEQIDLGDKASNRSPFRQWSVYVGENGTTAVLSAQPYQWIYPGEYIDIKVSMFAEEVSGDVEDRGYRLHDAKPGLAAYVKSSINDPETTNNYIFLPYRVIYRPRLIITSAEQPPIRLDRRKRPTVFRQETYGRRVLGENVGPKLNHTFLIENTGQSALHNLTFVLKIPFVLDDGQYLVYLPKQFRRRGKGANGEIMVHIGCDYHHFYRDLSIRPANSVEHALPRFLSADAEQVGKCHVPTGQYDLLKLSILIDEPTRTIPFDRSGMAQRLPGQESSNSQNIVRTPRGVNVFLSRVYPSKYSGHHNSSSHVIQMLKKRGTTVGCLSRTSFIQERSVKCMVLRCHLNKLKKGGTVRLRWVGWLWAETFFHLNEPDLKIVSSLALESWGSPPLALSVYAGGDRKNTTFLFDLPEKLPSWHIEQSVVFTQIRRRDPTHLPWWLIFAAVVIGLLLVALIVVLVRWCGWFHRHNRAQSNSNDLAEQRNQGVNSGKLRRLKHLRPPQREYRTVHGVKKNQLLNNDGSSNLYVQDTY